MKRKAAGTKALKKLRCHAAAVLGGGAVDPLCIARAESRFLSTIERIEEAGGCASTGDANLLESYVDQFVAQVVGVAGVSTTSSSTTSTVVPETTSTTFNFCGGTGTSCGPCPNGQMSTCYMLRDGGNACPSLNSCQASTARRARSARQGRRASGTTSRPTRRHAATSASRRAERSHPLTHPTLRLPEFP